MKISYSRLWKLLIDKKMNKTALKEVACISNSTLAKMGRDETVSMEVIGRICDALNCRMEDVIEIIPEGRE